MKLETGMANNSTLLDIKGNDSKMTGNDNNNNNKDRSERSFSRQAQRIIDSFKKSPRFSKKRSRGDPKVNQVIINIPLSDKKFFILYKGKIQVRGSRIHDAINGISQLVTDPTLYAPTCRTEKGENIHDNYAAELSTVRVNRSEIIVDGNGVDVHLPLMDLASCSTDLRVPQVVSIVTNIGNDFHCYALVCANRVTSNELVNHINQTFETVWKEWKRREKHQGQREDEKKVAAQELLDKKKRAESKRSVVEKKKNK